MLFGQIETASVRQSLKSGDDFARVAWHQFTFRSGDRTGKFRFDVFKPVRQKDARLVVPGFCEGNHPPPRCFVV